MTNALAPLTFDRKKLLQAVAVMTAESAPLMSFLRMDKAGEWAYGPDSLPVPETTEFAVDPSGFQHGYVAWGEGEKLGEIIVSVHEPIPEPGPVPGGAMKWEAQAGITLRAVTGEMANTQLVYRSSSIGGKRAIASLFQEIGTRLSEDIDRDDIIPVIELDSGSYKHSKFGKVYVPLFKVVRWMGIAAANKAATKPSSKKISRKK